MAFKSLKARFTETSHDLNRSVKVGRGHSLTKRLAQWIVEEKGIGQAHKGLNTAHNNLAGSIYKFGHEDGSADFADIFDKLSWIIAEMGTLHETYGAGKHEEFRQHLKVIRNTEDQLTKDRNGLEKAQEKLTKEKNKGPGKWDQTTLDQLENEVSQYENSLMQPESQAEHTKRTQLVAGLDENFDGLIELGEKLALLGGYGKLLINHVNQDYVNHQTEREPYNDAPQTSKILKGAQDALAQWQPKTSAPALCEDLGLPPLTYRDTYGAHLKDDDDDEEQSVSGSTVGGGSVAGSRQASGMVPAASDASTGGSAPQVPAKVGGFGEIPPSQSTTGSLDSQTRDLSLGGGSGGGHDDLPPSHSVHESSNLNPAVATPVSGPGAFLGSLSAPSAGTLEDEAPVNDTGDLRAGTNGPSHGSFARQETSESFKDAREA